MEKYGKEFALVAMENRENKVAQRVLVKLKVEPPDKELVELYLREIARTYGIEYPLPKNTPSSRRDGDKEGDVDMGSDDDDDEGGGGGSKIAAASTPRKTKKADEASKDDGDKEVETPPRRRDLKREDTEERLRRTSPPKMNMEDDGGDGFFPQGRSPISIAPPSPRVDNINPKIKLPLPVELQPKFGKGKNKTGDEQSGGGDTEMSGGGDVAAKGGGNSNAGGSGSGSGNTRGANGSGKEKESTTNKIPDVDELAARFARLKKT